MSRIESDDISEGEAIGWDYSVSDIAEEERIRNGELTEFEKMMDYHSLSEEDLMWLSRNELDRYWWNYSKFGKQK